MAIDSAFETDNLSTLRDIQLIVLKVVLFHLGGRGNLYEMITPNFKTKSRSSLTGLSNELSFVSESHVVPFQQVKMFCYDPWTMKIC